MSENSEERSEEEESADGGDEEGSGEEEGEEEESPDGSNEKEKSAAGGCEGEQDENEQNGEDETNPNAGWAEVMAKILGKKTPEDKPCILLKNKQRDKLNAKEKKEKLEKKKQVCVCARARIISFMMLSCASESCMSILSALFKTITAHYDCHLIFLKSVCYD